MNNTIKSSMSRCLRAYTHKSFSAYGSEVLQSTQDGVMIFTCRGTSKNKLGNGWLGLLWDIITDLRMLPWISRTTGIHPAGFFKIARQISYEIERKVPNKTTPIQLEGHSLGGAVALLAGALLSYQGYNIVRIFTFGSPKVGKIKSLDDTLVLQYRNGADIVPTLPPFYSHPTKLISYGKSKNPIRDHRMSEYRSRWPV